jgi:uncharacterized protein YdaU (DUF1376 family)
VSSAKEPAKKPLWFPLYAKDFMSSPDVLIMEAHEVGAYLLLMMHSWQSDTPGFLPNDEGRLRRASRLSVEAWKESGPLLLSKWPVAEDASMRYNPRLLFEAENAVELRKKKSEAGQKSAELKAARKAEAERLATERQQGANTSSTPVEESANTVAKKPNQSQLQSQSSKEDERTKGAQAGEISASQVESPPAAGTVGGPARLVFPDAAEVFTKNGFREFAKSIGFGGIDIGHYLVQIQQAASREEKARPNSGKGLTWEGFVKNYLNNDRLHNRLVYPVPADGQPGAQPQQRYGPAPTATVASGSYDRQAIAARQATQIII